MEKDTPTPTANTITRRGLLMGAGAMVLAAPLAACDDDGLNKNARTLKALGVDSGPALLYLSYPGCSDIGGPHDIDNLKKIADSMNVPAYVIDLENSMYLHYTNAPEEYKQELRDRVVGKQIKTLAGVPLPGKAILIEKDMANIIRTLGFDYNAENLLGHDGRIMLFDANLNQIGFEQTRSNATDTIKKFKDALSQKQAQASAITR